MSEVWLKWTDSDEYHRQEKKDECSMNDEERVTEVELND